MRDAQRPFREKSPLKRQARPSQARAGGRIHGTGAYLRSGISAALALTVAASLSAPVSAETTRIGFSLGGIQDDYLGRSERFGTLAFNGAALTAGAEFGAISAEATIAQTQHGDVPTLANYDLALTFGASPWQIGIGRNDRHWSPSNYTSLILSRNAPAFHSAYLRKSEATASDLPLLKWLGPWDGEVFFGVTDDAGQPDDALFFGMRARFRPIENLELDFVRTAQFGGAGQPQDGETLLRVLFGSTNSGAASGANQMAGVGISYSFPGLAEGARIYYQAVGEDEAGGLPSCFLQLGGVELKTSVFGLPSIFTLEHTDTRVDFSSNNFCGPNTAYNNATYAYTHRGTVLGSAIDSESVSTALYASHDIGSLVADWSVGHYQINDQSNPAHRLSSTRTDGILVSAGISQALLGGTLRAQIVHQDFELDTADMPAGTRLGLSFEASF